MPRRACNGVLMFVATRFFTPPPLPSPASPGRRGGIASSP
ncbi:hypothetical protein CHUV0807_1030 [Cardiobacterium hominis]|uniref:Uncharacterized protein n=1 Tax=Cardiobacterium hominis TaxID=2718 RepID=A0A1C3H3Y9_9GAMM|nr:hypothetical protein CHUV0807_1030 [Cardiobacterium hominis]